MQQSINLIALLSAVVPLLVVLITSFLQQRYQSSDAASRMTEAAMGMNERLEAENVRQGNSIQRLTTELAQWKRFALQCVEQLRRLGHVPDGDEPLVDYEEELVDALVGAFDLAGFDRMLRTIGKRRERLSTANGLQNVVSDVVDVARREGWLNRLKDGAREANPNNEQLRRAVGSDW